LRFFGNGVGDIDRVKIRVDEPPPSDAPGPPVDVGAEDFTIELFLRAAAAENPAQGVACGANLAWIEGNIVVDRDRYDQGRKFGVSLAGGRVVFGVTGAAGDSFTICATSPVTDDGWHHVAVSRRRSDGQLRVFVDGELEAEGQGPTGDVSYPDDGVPGDFCGGPCDFSDPFLVLGAEKHDAGPAYPSFSGYVDELRISRVLRYDGPFTPPTAPFVDDPETVGLYHFDEGEGLQALDSSSTPGGPTHGELRVGGSPEGPLWSTSTPW
jgi:hypothetical protein